MTLTPKENSLLCDLKAQDQLCIEKYGKYADEACDGALKNLFTEIKRTEEGHLSSITRIINGEEVTMSSSPSAAAKKWTGQPSSCPADAKKKDEFLCKDALTMEKHVSSLYDTAIFEFTSPTLRDTLNHIQKEEQIHGEQIYEYMKTNGMYQ